jgi:sn-glycerol 3-phosphate transport system substrate-binding protein
MATSSTDTPTSEPESDDQEPTTTTPGEGSGELVEIDLYYPIAVGGPLQELIDGLVTDFETENPDISVNAIYSGSYDETMVRAQTASRSGSPPAAAVLASTELYSLIHADLIAPFDGLATTDEDRDWLGSFVPAFMKNSVDGEGRTMSIPFQPSTTVQYWNKDLFAAAGLDPETPPATWDDIVTMGTQIVESGVAPNGIKVPSSAFQYALLQTFTTQNDVELQNESGDETYFDDPRAIEALEFWRGLASEHGIAPDGLVEWGTLVEDFLQGEMAVLWTTTGQMRNIADNATFELGVSVLPSNVHGGSATGGGHIYIFKDAPTEEQQAAFRLVRWLTQPERTAEWSIATGYVAAVPEAYETQAMQEYVSEFPPAGVALEQLETAVPPLTTYDWGRVSKALNDAVSAVLTGQTSAEDALTQAQAQAEALLAPYR